MVVLLVNSNQCSKKTSDFTILNIILSLQLHNYTPWSILPITFFVDKHKVKLIMKTS